MVFVFWNLSGAAMTALFPGITLIGVARPTYLKSGRMMPENDFGQLRSFDAIYLGAVGYPASDSALGARLSAAILRAQRELTNLYRSARSDEFTLQDFHENAMR